MNGPTPEMLADPSLGACKRTLPGCIELGLWRPFYQGYICDTCLAADQSCVKSGHLPADWPGARGGAQEAGCNCGDAQAHIQHI